METFLRDLQYSLRTLRLNPGFAAVAVTTLALGIGASTSMFSVLDGVLLKSLRYPDAERIVAISTEWTDSGKLSPRTTGGDLEDLRASDSFEAFSYYQMGETGVQLKNRAELVGAYEVDPDFFHVFAVSPISGRTFRADDAGRAAVVGTAFAQRNFASPSAALRQSVRFRGRSYEIIGVMPPGFQFPKQAEVWAAVWPTPENRNRSAYNYYSIAKLKPGSSRTVANSQLLAIANRLGAAFPGTNRNKTFIVVPLQEQLAASIRTTLLLLMGAVGLVLLIACANVANLMLARSTARSRELAVRAALGARRGRLVRQLLAESLGLALAGGVLGLAMAAGGTKALLGMGAQFIPAPLLGDIHLDLRVLAFAIVISITTTIVFGMAPAWKAARVDLQDALKQTGNHGPIGTVSSRLCNFLVIAQISFSLMLAIGAGLLFRTLLALHEVQLGYRPEGMLVASTSAPARTLPEALRAGRLFDDLLGRLGQLPGVTSTAAAMGLPASDSGSNGYYAVEGRPTYSGDYRKQPHAAFTLASPGYFTSMGIRLLRGRDFNDGDLYDRPFVVIVSESVVRQIFPNEDPIGHRIKCGLDSDNWMTIVGVVGDVRQNSPAAQPGPELYMPIRQHPLHGSDLQFVLRTSGNPEALIPAVQNTIREMNPEVAAKFTTMDDMVRGSISAQRFRTILTSSFALLALLLALSGMYALMSYITARRTAEFGLRSALGAQPRNILVLVLGDAAKLVAIGAVAGVVLSVLSGRLLSTMLFSIRSTDPATYVLITAIVLPVVVLAAALPAWRASRIDPMIALRNE